MRDGIIQKAITKAKEPFMAFIELDLQQEQTIQTQLHIANLKAVVYSLDKLEQELIEEIKKEMPFLNDGVMKMLIGDNE